MFNNFENLNFATLDTSCPNSLVYLIESKYLFKINNNPNISAVITTKEFSKLINKNIDVVIDDDPVSYYYSNFIKLSKKKYSKSSLSTKAMIEDGAQVSDYGVIIEDGVIVEKNAVIKSGVTLKKDSIIRSGAIIGGDGFQIVKIYGKNVVVPHNCGVVICENVDIGYNTCVDKGMFCRDTVIGKYTKIDNLCHIAHNVHIGEECKIAAGSCISGSCKVGNCVWIGPNSTIRDNITIGDNSRITIGSTVWDNVKSNTTVTGYFAIEHFKFLDIFSFLLRK